MGNLSSASFFSSRLLGQNRFFAVAGSIMDISLSEVNNQEIANLYIKELDKILEKLPIKEYEIKQLVFPEGINIAIRYPYDLLMTACEILDWVWLEVVDNLDKEFPIRTQKGIDIFTQMIEENQRIILRKIYNKALEKKVNFFIHKDWIILGSGVSQFRVKQHKITKLSDIPWKKIANVPMVLITGTNGKTTTTRLTEFICRKSGLKSGYCSTDWVMVGGRKVAEGDLSGPTGHQYVMMHPKLEVAVLEAARGGIVKRGLMPNYADVATVTNIAYDHIGQNGINTLSDLANAKAVVYDGLADDGIAIVNLDDVHVMSLDIKQRKSYMSTKLSEDAIAKYLTTDNYVVYLDNDIVTLQTLKHKYHIIDIKKVPLTVHGLAKYNYENTLHAVALSYGIGIEIDDIKFGLKKFGADDKSNFGRWNYYKSKERGHLVVDIAHNPSGLNNILTLANGFKDLHNLTGRIGLMYGNTADRRDTIPEIVSIINKHNVDFVVIKEFQESLRGSELGEMPQVFYDELIKQGYPVEKIKVIPNEYEAVQYILLEAKPDDFTLLCSHELINDVSKLLRDTVAFDKKK
ncbi:MAG: Mur ligase family protein [Burkholderiales bacterium]|nr:Mur ligase family protein [Burkholderiales bacterium]